MANSTTLKKKPALSPPCGFAEVVQYIEDSIRSGAYASGDRLPSFVELQSRFGTTPNTVNRAMIELERAGLISREKGRGVFVAMPKSERCHSIGLIDFRTPNSSSPYHALLMNGVEQVAKREGYEIILLDHDSNRGLEKVDGVLIHGEYAHGYFERLPPKTPFVSVMNPLASAASVGIDDFAAGHAATQYLLSLGHRRIGFSGHLDSPLTQRRLSGYENALRSAGIVPNPDWARTIIPKPKEESLRESPTLRLLAMGHVGGTQWLAGDRGDLGVTAFIVQNDEYAIGFMRALQEAGLNVPGDVSVMGFDSTEICEMCSPRLTSMHFPLIEIGALAAEQLMRQIRGEAAAALGTLFPAALDVRDSTAPPPAA